MYQELSYSAPARTPREDFIGPQKSIYIFSYFFFHVFSDWFSIIREEQGPPLLRDQAQGHATRVPREPTVICTFSVI